MKQFDQRFNTICEGLKDPKDNPCWKGYKPVGTKKLRGKTVPNCVPKETTARGNPLPLPEKKENVNPVVKEFFKYAIKKLGIQNVPTVVFNTDKGRVNELRSMAGYMPKENKIWVYTNKRNAADIVRSLAHELVHCKQQESNPGKLINGSTGSDDENEANSVAGILLRTYGKQNPLIYEAFGAGGSYQYKIISSFSELPETPPHGFWVLPDGRYIPVYKIFGHDEALEALFPNQFKNKYGYASLQDAMKGGMIRMAKMPGNVYGLTYHPMYVKSGKAKKTAKDIAQYYGFTVEDDFEGL